MAGEVRFQEDERILYLEIPAAEIIRDVARRLSRGLIVALGSDENVAVARREHSQLDNVMFLVATPDKIPWRDQFFTQVIDAREGDWPDAGKVRSETARVLSRDPRSS